MTRSVLLNEDSIRLLTDDGRRAVVVERESVTLVWGLEPGGDPGKALLGREDLYVRVKDGGFSAWPGMVTWDVTGRVMTTVFRVEASDVVQFIKLRDRVHAWLLEVERSGH